jgi:F0F1-type ATP synthase assembly protein I
VNDDDDSRRDKQNRWHQLGRISQLGLLLPASTVAGWFLGSVLDHWLHTNWINVAGLFVGTIAGLVEVIRAVMASDSKQ